MSECECPCPYPALAWLELEVAGALANCKVLSSDRDQLCRRDIPSGVGDVGERVGEAKGEPCDVVRIDVDVEMPRASGLGTRAGWDGRRRCVPSISRWESAYMMDDTWLCRMV